MNDGYEAMTDTQKIGRHALVIGGSLAGLFAARVLADFFDKVTILDRDVFPVTPDHRKGIPQSYHALLPTAFPILERVLPYNHRFHFR
jgi:flavin-dependent dehydrogenase